MPVPHSVTCALKKKKKYPCTKNLMIVIAKKHVCLLFLLSIHVAVLSIVPGAVGEIQVNVSGR